MGAAEGTLVTWLRGSLSEAHIEATLAWPGSQWPEEPAVSPLHDSGPLSIVTEHKFLCPMHSEARQTETLEFRAMHGDGWLMPPKPNSLKGFSKALLKARWGRALVTCCKLLGVRILCSCPHRSGHMFLLTSNKTNVILCSATFYLCMNGLLKVRALRIGCHVYFRL